MANSAFQLPNPSGGTVTSVGVTSSTLTVTNSPITGFGNINIEMPAATSNAVPQNLIFNGSFLLWQRGITFSTAGTLYGPDRWQVSGNGGTNGVFSQQPGPTSGTFYLRVQRNPGDTGVADLMVATSLTRDMCIGAAGQQLTLTFKVLRGANFSAASNLMTCQIYSGTGTTDTSIIGGFSGVVLQANPITTLTTIEQTITVNTLTLGTNVTTLAALFRYTPTGTAGANDWFEIRDVQLAIGANVVGYEHVPLAQEIDRCIYFYEKSFNLATAPAQNAGAAGAHRLPQTVAASTVMYASMIKFSGRKRIAPTVTVFNTNAVNAQARNLNTNTDATNTAIEGAAETGFGLSLTTPAATTSSQVFAIHWAADAEIT